MIENKVKEKWKRTPHRKVYRRRIPQNKCTALWRKHLLSLDECSLYGKVLHNKFKPFPTSMNNFVTKSHQKYKSTGFIADRKMIFVLLDISHYLRHR